MKHKLIGSIVIFLYINLLFVISLASVEEPDTAFRKTGVNSEGVYFSTDYNENIDLFSGNLNFQQTDLAFKSRGGMDIALTRTYNSKIWDKWLSPSQSNNYLTSGISNSGFGVGWSFFIAKTRPESDYEVSEHYDTFYEVVFGDGSRQKVLQRIDPDTGWPNYLDEFILPDFSRMEVKTDEARIGSGVGPFPQEMTTTSGLTYRFEHFAATPMGEIYADPTGTGAFLHTTSIRDMHGNEITIEYYPETEYIKSITAPNGARIELVLEQTDSPLTTVYTEASYIAPDGSFTKVKYEYGETQMFLDDSPKTAKFLTRVGYYDEDDNLLRPKTEYFYDVEAEWGLPDFETYVLDRVKLPVGTEITYLYDWASFTTYGCEILGSNSIPTNQLYVKTRQVRNPDGSTSDWEYRFGDLDIEFGSAETTPVYRENEVESPDGTITRMRFFPPCGGKPGVDAFAGKMYYKEIEDNDGRILSKEYISYTPRNLGRWLKGSNNGNIQFESYEKVMPQSKVVWKYDPEYSPGRWYYTQYREEQDDATTSPGSFQNFDWVHGTFDDLPESDYDLYGNRRYTIEYGEVRGPEFNYYRNPGSDYIVTSIDPGVNVDPGDDRITKTKYMHEYEGNCKDYYLENNLVHLPVKTSLYDSSGELWSQTIIDYDGSNMKDLQCPYFNIATNPWDLAFGDVTKTTQVGLDGVADIVKSYQYDNYGNIIKKIGPMGHSWNFEYSPVYSHSWLTAAYDPYGRFIIQRGYYPNGQVSWEKDPNDQYFRYMYDQFFRLTKVVIAGNWRGEWDITNPNLVIEYDDENRKVMSKSKIDYG